MDKLDIPCVPLYFEFVLGKGGATTYIDMVLINLEKGFPWVQELDLFPCLSCLSMSGESAVGTKTGFATCIILRVQD